MSKATGKDHARINLDIWGNDDWLDLSPLAQHLYYVLWTSPQLSYCGTGEWHPGKIASKAKGWTAGGVEQAGAELSRELFLVVDTSTEEFLLRSWIKHDGLLKQANLAVSMANARADLSSRILRGVIVFEVAKLRKRNPDFKGWERDAVVKMLEQKAINPAELEPFNPPVNPSVYPTVYPYADPPVNPPVDPTATRHLQPCANPSVDPGPTPSPAPFSNSIGGYVSREPHESADPGPEPPAYCNRHPNGTNRACEGCRQAREAHNAWTKADVRYHADVRAAFWCQVVACDDCDPNGWLAAADGKPSVRCPNHDWSQLSA